MISSQKTANPGLSEKVVVAGETIELNYEDIPLEELALDTDNPRIRYRLKLEQNGKSLDEVINEMPEVAALRKDIKTNGGLRERIIVKPIAGGRFKVVEGNVRFTCISGLHQLDPTDDRWKSVPARVLPEDVSEKTVAILLSDQHVAGKIPWKAHEKAGQIHHMKQIGIPVEDIAVYLRTSKSVVGRLLQAYSLMTDVYLAMPEYKDKGEGKFSFFLQAFYTKKIRERMISSAGFKKDLSRWIGDGKIPETSDIKLLPDILERPSVRKQFEETVPLKKEGESSAETTEARRKWFDDIYKIVAMDEPEKGFGPNADFHKAIVSFNNQIDNANVGDLKMMESDEMLHRRIISAYESLVDLMSKIGMPMPSKKRSAA